MTNVADSLPASVLNRKAIVYVRQSTQTQVQTNLESKRRQYDLVELARAKGYEVIERHILPEELSTFSECFLTGTAAEVTPVSQIGEYSFTPAAISLDLMDTYAKLVRRA